MNFQIYRLLFTKVGIYYDLFEDIPENVDLWNTVIENLISSLN